MALRAYEITTIINPGLDQEGLETVVEKVKGLFTGSGGRIDRVEPWGVRRLAYPIQGLREGQYVLFTGVLNPSAIREIERSLRVDERIVRHLVVSVDEVPQKPSPKEETPASTTSAEEVVEEENVEVTEAGDEGESE